MITQRHTAHPSGQPAGCISFILAAIGYAILSVRQPAEYGQTIWIGLAFLLLPMLIGAIVGNRVGPQTTPGPFWQGWWPAAIAMFGYATINLAILRSRFSAGGSAGQIMLVMIFLSAFYGAISGSVAGMTALAWHRFGRNSR